MNQNLLRHPSMKPEHSKNENTALEVCAGGGRKITKTLEIAVCLAFACFLSGIVLGNTGVPEKKPQPAQHATTSGKTVNNEGRNQKTTSHSAILQEHFEKEFLASIPVDVYDSIPAEIMKTFESITPFKNAKGEKYSHWSEWLEQMIRPAASYLTNRKILVKVSVVDENGKPINGAFARLLQTRLFEDSNVLGAYGGHGEPYKIKKTTDDNGECTFSDIDAQGVYSLSAHLFGKGEMPENNILLEVRASGFQSLKKGFVNVDKASLALGCKFVEAILRHKDLMPKEGKEGWLKALTTKKKIIIPEENTKDVIEIKVVLRKETKDMSRNPDSANPNTPENK